MQRRKLNAGNKRRTKLGVALERSAKEILAHITGDVKLPTRSIAVPDKVKVRAGRARTSP
jgi:hypothetical protein